MAYHIVVTHPVGVYKIGDKITDPESVRALSESHPAHVVRVHAPDPEPTPEPAPVADDPDPAPAPEWPEHSAE